MDAVLSKKCSYCQTPTFNQVYCCNACEILATRTSTQPDADSLQSSRYSFLDQPNFKSKYRLFSQPYDYELFVEGLHCSSCIHLLENIPDFDPTVIEARVDYSHSILRIKTTSDFSLSGLAGLLHSWGYTPHYLEKKSSTIDLELNENRLHLKRLAVAGACAGNIMLFVVPVYTGLNGPWASAFNWMSFFIFLPILFYSAIPFYQGAWTSLRYKNISIDLPITVALLGGFILSTVNLVRGDGAIYYDSTASFLFLILGARYFTKYIQQSFLRGIEVQDYLKNDLYLKKIPGTYLAVGLNELYKNDVLLLKTGQTCPIDGTIQKGSALFDTAVLNGEPLPKVFEAGMTILAGSQLLSENTEIGVKSAYEKSYLAELLLELKNGSWKKSHFISLTDRLSQKLVITVFLLAIVFFIFYARIDLQEALNRSLALIVLACPCALAFASPLALGLAMKKAFKNGIIVKNITAIEKLLSVEKIFFDKTGTLTETDLELKSTWPPSIDDRYKSIILSLEQKSYHPVAFALRKNWRLTERVPVLNYREQLGRGVSGIINDHSYELNQCLDSKVDTGLCISLSENGKTVCKLYFDSTVREESPNAVANLKEKNRACFLLTGDTSIAATKTGYACHIPGQNIFSSQSPEGKRDIVSRFKNTCMIGDGTNDALALQAADIGIAVKGSTYFNLQAADVYFTRAGLSPLIELFDLCMKTKRILVANLTFSLFYNVIGGGLALCGFVSPMLAAILMPISSVTLITFTLWGLR